MALFPEGIPVSKRIFDLVFATIAGIIIFPFTLLISLIIWIDMGRPILFKQKRPGFKGELFQVYKFRTMTFQKDSQGNLLPDAQRLTKLGKFLRSFSLDEFPELINIYRGEMSLIGPRPLLTKYLELYSPQQFRRHEMLPGITGWAQVHGRNILTWEEKFNHDVWYIDHWSIGLDIKIIFLTIIPVLQQKGISQPGQATATEFMGNNTDDEKSNKSL